MEKMTKKNMFEFIANAMADNADVVTFCENEIAQLEKKAAKSKEQAAKKRAESDVLTEVVFNALSDETFDTTAAITERIGNPEVTVAKVVARMTKLIKAGRAEKQEVTIPATETSKARKCMAYRKIA